MNSFLLGNVVIWEGGTLMMLISFSAATVMFIAMQARHVLVRRAEMQFAARQAEMVADLKAGMVERGFSADEIERVVATKPETVIPGSTANSTGKRQAELVS